MSRSQEKRITAMRAGEVSVQSSTDSPTAPTNELLVSLKEMHAACVSLMEVAHMDPRAGGWLAAWRREQERRGIAAGFLVRADAAILRAEGKL